MVQKISLRVIIRVSIYYEALLRLNLEDESYISSKQLEEVTGLSCNQIRQDLFYLGLTIGKQRKGYQVDKLFKELKKVLSIDTGAEVIVIGAGRLGRALSEYKLFKVRNINVRALFDIKSELVGTFDEVKGAPIPIYHTDQLESYLNEHPEIKLALLTVPEQSAQEMLDRLIGYGIRGVVNFTPRILKLPKGFEDVHLVNECIGAALYKIVYQLSRSS